MTNYSATHDQLVDVVQRIGSRIGSAFTDGGIHPRFGILGKQVILLQRKSSFNTWNKSYLRNQAIYIQDNEQILNDFDISYDFAGDPLNRYRKLTNLARAQLGWDYA